MKAFKIIFTLVGFVFLILAVSIFLNKKSFMKSAIKTKGKVIYAGETTTISFLDLNNNKREYSPSLKCTPPCYDLNEVVDVYYDKNSDDVMISGFTAQYLLVSIFGILGFIFFSIGLGFIIAPIIRKNKGEKYKNLGIKLETEIIDISINKYIRVNRKHPYNIITEWVDEDANRFQFKSPNLWVNPKNYINENSVLVTVYVDKANFNKYYMDISFLDD